MKNRKAAEEIVLSWVKDIDLDGKTVAWYKERFAVMTDAQFEKWILLLDLRMSMLL